uniref:Uncharacterized protein n=1 Tax=Setaria digitata TaxID=48799 RepID=A0A915PD71_9BILA
MRQVVAYRKQLLSSNIGLQFVSGLTIGILLGFFVKFCYENDFSANSAQIFTIEEVDIATINTKKTYYHWDLYREIIKYSSNHERHQNLYWTVISDEKTFIIMANLRRFLISYDPEEPLVIARIFNKRNLISYMFPWVNYKRITLQSGVIFSRTALDYLISEACLGFLSSYATEKALLQCSSHTNVHVVDPIDQDGKHLLTTNAFKEMRKKLEYSAKMKDELQCYSNQAVSFGNINYQTHRLLDFTINRINVFGR